MKKSIIMLLSAALILVQLQMCEVRAVEPENDIKTIGTALILNSYPASVRSKDSYSYRYRTEKYDQIKEEWGQKGLITTVDIDVTLDDFRQLDTYDIVYIASHGKVVSVGGGSYPVVYLSEKVSDANDAKYEDELKNQLITKVGDEYVVLPAFFIQEYEGNRLNNTIVLSESCQFMGNRGNENYSMTEALVSVGAEAVVGFHNNVGSEYAFEFLGIIVNDLIEEKTIGTSYEQVKEAIGEDQKIWYDQQNYERTTAQTGPYDPDASELAYPLFVGNRSTLLGKQTVRSNSNEITTLVRTKESWNVFDVIKLYIELKK